MTKPKGPSGSKSAAGRSVELSPSPHLSLVLLKNPRRNMKKYIKKIPKRYLSKAQGLKKSPEKQNQLLPPPPLAPGTTQSLLQEEHPLDRRWSRVWWASWLCSRRKRRAFVCLVLFCWLVGWFVFFPEKKGWLLKGLSFWSFNRLLQGLCRVLIGFL